MLDLFQLVLFYGNTFIAVTIAAVIIFYGEPSLKCRHLLNVVGKEDGYDECIEGNKWANFFALNVACAKCLMTLLNVSKTQLDLIKATAFVHRTVKVMEVLEEFHEFHAPGSLNMKEHTSVPIRPLASGEIILPLESDHIEFSNCAVYTPDGTRLLIPNISLELLRGESHRRPYGLRWDRQGISRDYMSAHH